MQSPLIGNGPGAAVELISARFQGIAHPHNEYLRIFHDFGIVGVLLFFGGMLMLIGRVMRRIRQTDHAVHWSALLATLSIFASAVTDNPLNFQFIMIPAAVLIGLSLSHRLNPASRIGDISAGSRAATVDGPSFT
jgi:O-antigen ligase